MDNLHIERGDVVYDKKIKDVFIIERIDMLIMYRLRLATEEEKNKLAASGKNCISLN